MHVLLTYIHQVGTLTWRAPFCHPAPPQFQRWKMPMVTSSRGTYETHGTAMHMGGFFVIRTLGVLT